MKKIMVVAPHPDDETFGCGGSLLRHRILGDQIHWLIVTGVSTESGYAQERVITRKQEIAQVAKMYEFASVDELNFPTAKLDTIEMQTLITAIGKAINKIKPNFIYIPYRGDIHTDHQIVFDAVNTCTKWFRYPFIKKVLAYETLSETDLNLNPDIAAFKPNCYTQINSYLGKKIAIAKIYESEYGEFPFPRSEKAIQALANYRGAQAGFNAAEAFILLREVND